MNFRGVLSAMEQLAPRTQNRCPLWRLPRGRGRPQRARVRRLRQRLQPSALGRRHQYHRRLAPPNRGAQPSLMIPLTQVPTQSRTTFKTYLCPSSSALAGISPRASSTSSPSTVRAMDLGLLPSVLSFELTSGRCAELCALRRRPRRPCRRDHAKSVPARLQRRRSQPNLSNWSFHAL